MQARFFFEPRQLCTQSPDLGIQFVQLPFVLCFPELFSLAFILEQLVEILQRLFLPVLDLVRMDPVLGRDLNDALLFLQCFEHDRWKR